MWYLKKNLKIELSINLISILLITNWANSKNVIIFDSSILFFFNNLYFISLWVNEKSQHEMYFFALVALLDLCTLIICNCTIYPVLFVCIWYGVLSVVTENFRLTQCDSTWRFDPTIIYILITVTLPTVIIPSIKIKIL